MQDKAGIMKGRLQNTTVRRWLHRIDDGESLQDIANSDNVSVRTVKRYLELAEQELVIQKARQVVLSQTLEKHYADLCTFAGELDSKLMEGFEHISLSGDDALMFDALHQHIPNSSIWKRIEEREDVLTRLETLSSKFKGRVIGGVEERLPRKAIDSEEKLKLVLRLRALAKGWQEDEDVPYTADRFQDEDDETQIQPGTLSWVGPIGVSDHLQKTNDTVLDGAIDSQEYDEVHKCVQRLQELRDTLHNELTVVVLRRMLPGRCVYCPL